MTETKYYASRDTLMIKGIKLYAHTHIPYYLPGDVHFQSTDDDLTNLIIYNLSKYSMVVDYIQSIGGDVREFLLESFYVSRHVDREGFVTYKDFVITLKNNSTLWTVTVPYPDLEE